MDRKLTLSLCLLLGVSALAFTPYLPFFGPRNPNVVTDWASRVVANGGAMPSQTSIIAMETLRVSLEAQSLTNKIYTLCIFVPDSVIAASTPLVKIKGADPWTNSGFVSGDLNIQGLKGDGNKFLDTAIIPLRIATNNNNIATTNMGLSTVVTESATNNATAVIMDQKFPSGLNTTLGLFASGGGSNQFYAGRVGGTSLGITTNDLVRVGYLSGNRSGSNQILCLASPIESHKVISSNATTFSLLDSGLTSTLAFYRTVVEGTNNGSCFLRLSMGCIHEAFTETESSNFWWAVKTCRQSLGGGDGDPIWDWARYVTNFGGAAISANTSNALRTFRQGLDTDSLLYKMLSVNAMVPDSLTAVRMPIVWQAGLQLWTNVLFDATNLTVEGLSGNGTSKYLGTGLNPAGIGYAGFGSSNAGISLMIRSNTANGSFELAGSGTSANSFFTVDSDGAGAGLLRYACWKFVNPNTNFVLRAKGTSWTNGWISGNRTASNAIALHWVTNHVHNIATNSAVLETSGTPTITNMFAFANSSSSTPGNFSDRTVSFIALHAGLTQTEDSNLWYRVDVLRTNLGGGYVP